MAIVPLFFLILLFGVVIVLERRGLLWELGTEDSASKARTWYRSGLCLYVLAVAKYNYPGTVKRKPSLSFVPSGPWSDEVRNIKLWRRCGRDQGTLWGTRWISRSGIGHCGEDEGGVEGFNILYGVMDLVGSTIAKVMRELVRVASRR